MINFKIKLGIKKDHINCDIPSVINYPITMEGKCVGIITNYNLDTDEATGFLFDNIYFNLNQNKSICSMEIIQNKYKNN